MAKKKIKLLDTVALADDLPERKLKRGEVGTVVEILASDVFEVEFSDDDGQTYAELALRAEQLIALHTISQKEIVANPIQQSHRPKTAFIVMCMDSNHPELEDVSNAIKEVCTSFNIKAVRDDDVAHQGRITDVVLQHIAESEILIADVSGERPNVYFEVGYAYALNKRPILYRRQGTKLHFDLSIHNVPEYKNVTDLKLLLKRRLEAILGRSASFTPQEADGSHD